MRTGAAHKGFRRLALIASAAAILTVFIPWEEASGRSSAILVPMDKTAPPGLPVRLEARLLSGGFPFGRRPISGERLEFFLEGRSLGQALTGGDGLAVKTFTPPRTGLYSVTVRLVDNPRFESDPVELVVASRGREHPVLFVDIAALRDPASPPMVPFTPRPSVEPIAEAVDILVRLARRYQIIYLDSGGEAAIAETKSWLTGEDIPSAPVRAWKAGGPGSGRSDGARMAVREWKKEEAGSPRAAITRSLADAEGFRQAGLISVFIGEEDSPVAEGVKRVETWGEIPAALGGRGAGPGGR